MVIFYCPETFGKIPAVVVVDSLADLEKKTGMRYAHVSQDDDHKINGVTLFAEKDGPLFQMDVIRQVNCPADFQAVSPFEPAVLT